VSSAKRIVDRLLEADEFSARDYLATTPDEEFDEGIASLLKQARQLYALFKRENIIKVSATRRKGALFDPDQQTVALAVLQIAMEREAGRDVRRIYLNLKRHGRFRY
jgi:hypothetical protein